jgi:hypothetical protein
MPEIKIEELRENLRLRWTHESKAYNCEDLRQLKAGDAGFVPLSKRLQQMLLRRYPINAEPEALIFPTLCKGSMKISNVLPLKGH